MKKKSRKKSSRPVSFYTSRKLSLRGIHRFSFRNTKNFTGAQKGAITRAYNKYKWIIRGQRLDHGTRVIPATPSQIRKAGGRYKHTNIGLIITSRAEKISIVKRSDNKKIIKKYSRKNKTKRKIPEKMTEREADRLLRLEILREYFGDFDDRTLVIEKGNVREQIFVPLLPGEKIDDLIDYMWWKFNPTHILFGVGSGQSTESFTEDGWEKYRETLIHIDRKVGDYYMERGKPVESPFTGAYAVWHSFKQRKTNTIKKKKVKKKAKKKSRGHVFYL